MSQKLLEYILAKKHHAFRRSVEENWAEEYRVKGMTPIERMPDRFERLTAMEVPNFLPEEEIVFVRSTGKAPDIFTEEEWAEIRQKHFIHELGYLSNLSPNYEDTIAVGLLEKRKTANSYGQRVIDAILDLSDRYQQEAERLGKTEIANVLRQVPRYGARNFREALQFFRILHFSLWLEGDYHNTVGRFDQYMFPYLQKDLADGTLNRESALNLVEDFFLSFNKDSDLYVGVQQGDNGQSMVLGGLKPDGTDGFNLLSELCLIASGNLKLIDPKINIRVSKNTPLSVFELGSRLTKEGLGFPQYSNDDVVIEGLKGLGYEEQDARNYVEAACWEFIIPKVGADIANIGALSFPRVVDTVFRKNLFSAETFEEFQTKIREEIQRECDEITAGIKNLWFVPSPFLTLLSDSAWDVSQGGKYNNFGIHGTGIATAADSLAAIKKYVYEEQVISKKDYLEAVESDFSQHEELLPLLRYQAPKMGTNDDSVDEIAVWLLESFSDALKGKRNCRGGIYRAGTGSAMFYLWHANEIGASPDGRRKGEAFGTNFSPSLFAKIDGPISVVSSFTKPDFSKTINGGPLTLEFHGSMFRDEESVGKVARLVKTFIDMGGHQLQLNAVNADKLRDAQKSPEKYPQLVVRIWGWSAYFVELDKEYQDHVLARQEYSL